MKAKPLAANMISSSEKKICTICQKTSEVFICRGCRQPFCAKHVGRHREKLSKDMNTLISKCDRLRQDSNSENLSRPILSRIDAWENESIEKIRTAAKTVRIDVGKWFSEVKREFEIPFQKMMDELQKSRQIQDYTEIDFQRWYQQLKEFHQKLDRHPIIEFLDDDDKDKNPDEKGLIRLIKIIDNPDLNQSYETNGTLNISEQYLDHFQDADTFQREKFGEILGTIILSEDNHIATYEAPWMGNASVCGTNLYSSGIHHLHFRIIEKFYDSPFFGIITESQIMTERIFECPSINGWKNFDFCVINGKHDREGRDRIIRSGDNVTLTLDCERRQLFFRHHRTDRLLHLPIDLRFCPFPWKMLIVFRRRGDSVRLLGGTVNFMTIDLMARLHEQLET